jgi:hypothetical protein
MNEVTRKWGHKECTQNVVVEGNTVVCHRVVTAGDLNKFPRQMCCDLTT